MQCVLRTKAAVAVGACPYQAQPRLLGHTEAVAHIRMAAALGCVGVEQDCKLGEAGTAVLATASFRLLPLPLRRHCTAARQLT